jgi:hypothetical protein
MQTGFNDSAWPVMAGLKWRKTYHATLATPISVRDLLAGQVIWVAIRVTMTAAVFAAVGVAFGAIPIGGAVFAVGPGLLTGLAFAGLVTAFTASLKKEIHLSSLQRFGIVPMFLFSGTFFPVTELPGWVQPIAYLTPLWHGVELTRAVSLGLPMTFSPPRPHHLSRRVRRRRHRAGGPHPRAQALPVSGLEGSLRVVPPPWRLGGARHLLERNVLVYRHSWVLIFSGFFEPLFYLFAIGRGVGALVGDVQGPLESR